LRLRTWERYESILRVHVVPAIGAKRLTRLQPADVQALYERMLACGMCSTTVHQIHAVLRRALSQAERRGLVARNVAALVEALRRHRTAQAAERLREPRWVDLDLVFPNGIGRFQESAKLWSEFRRLRETAGVPKVRFHDLRHTAATLMLSRGVHPKIASEM